MFGFPIFLVLRLIPRALRMNTPLADRLDGPWLIGSMAFVDTGRWRWTTTGFG
jgi:hypothetical protein